MPRFRFLLAMIAAAATLLTGLSTARAQDVEVTASVNRRHLSPGETVTYTILVEGPSRPDVQNPRPPQASQLTLLRADPRASRNITVINGRIHQRISFQWSYQANSEGSPHIGPAHVVVDGRVYETDPITLDVEGRRGQRAPGSSETRARIEGLYIEARPSRTQVVPGQQVTVEYVLYFRDGLRVENSRMAGSWKADGLWREELDVERRPVPETVIVDGLRYQTVTLKRVAVFPTHDGEFEVDPLEIEADVQRTGTGLRPFPFNRLRSDLVVSQEIASPPVTIRARPLPDGAPAAFDGAVGSYRMSVEYRMDRPRVGTAFDLRVRIEGTGNIATLSPPALRLPNEFDAFDPEIDESIDRSGRRLEGAKTFTFPVVPREAGTYRLPGVAFAYYDPDAGRYRSLESDPRTVTVEAGDPAASADPARPDAERLAGPMTASEAGDAPSPALYRQAWPYALLGGPALIAAGLFLLMVRRRRRAGEKRTPRADELAEEHLDRADTLRRKERARAFYAEVDRAVRAFVETRLDVAAGGMSQGDLDTHLAEANVPEETRARLTKLLEECERARFSPDPPGPSAMSTATSRALRCLEDVDRATTPGGPAATPDADPDRA